MKTSRRGRTRFTAALLLVAIAFALAYWTWRTPARPHAQSFVLIVIDTLRADHLGSYGSTRGLTPSLDALAKESVVFENAIATSAWTRSSIASMFTSQFPSPIGVMGRKDAIPESVTTLAEVLAQSGYATFGVTTNGNAGASIGFAQGFKSFVYPKLTRSYPGDAKMYPAEGVTQTGLDWVSRIDPKQPFFLFLHYTDPHDPYFPHEGLLPGAEPRGRYNGSRPQLRQMDHASREGLLQPEDMERIKYLYAGEVKYCDLWIGKLIDGFKQLRRWDDMMMVVTADHGEGLWDHGFRAHGRDLYEEMIRVPLLVRYPGARGHVARVAEPISLVDLAPTMLAEARLPVPAEFQGRDLGPLAAGEKRPQRGPHGIYAELGLDHVHLESVRLASEKLIRNRQLAADDPTGYQLFDLKADPGEQRNLAQQESGAKLSLTDTLASWRAALADSALAAQRSAPLHELNATDLESMKALGYLDKNEYEDALRRRQQREHERP